MTGSLVVGDGVSRSAAADADLFNALFGPDTAIINTGRKMVPSIYNNNTVRVVDGTAIRGGYPVRLPNGTHEDYAIPTGAQGVTREYYLGYKMTQSSGGLTIEQYNSTTMPSSVGSIREGDTTQYLILWKATLTGVELSKVETLVPVRGTVPYGTSVPTVASFGGSEYYDQIIE